MGSSGDGSFHQYSIVDVSTPLKHCNLFTKVVRDWWYSFYDVLPTAVQEIKALTKPNFCTLWWNIHRSSMT